MIALLTIVALVCGAATAAPKADAKARPAAAASAKASDKAPSDKGAPADAAKPAAKDAEKPAAPTLKVEKKGSYVYWFTYKDAAGAALATLPVRFKGKSTDLDISAMGDKPAGAKLFVMNRATGILAVTAYPSATGSKDVDLKADDLQYIRTVRLRIVAEDGKPIESAIVHITDGMNAKMTALVTPADEGVATFSNVASGETTVKVEAEGLRKTIDSDIEIEPGPTPGYEQDVKVAGDVNTLNIKPKSKGGETKRESSSGIGTVLTALAGFIVLILIVVIVIVVLKAKGITSKAALQGLGVELPGDAAGQGVPGAPAGPAIDPSVCQFCGQRKDANGQCACSVLPGAAAPAAMSSSSAGPRLVGFQGVYSGHIFEITGGSMLMGRESDNPIPLSNDSTASRRHATISQSNGGYSIRDEGSSNGTFVNGAKITEQKLSPGDEIQVGGTKFRFEM